MKGELLTDEPDGILDGVEGHLGVDTLSLDDGEHVSLGLPGQGVDHAVLEGEGLGGNIPLLHAENVQSGGERLLGLGVHVNLGDQVLALALPHQFALSKRGRTMLNANGSVQTAAMEGSYIKDGQQGLLLDGSHGGNIEQGDPGHVRSGVKIPVSENLLLG